MIHMYACHIHSVQSGCRATNFVRDWLQFIIYLWHFAALCLPEASTDRRETFKYDWKCGHSKFGTTFQKILAVNGLGAKSRSPLGRSPQNFAKRCELGLQTRNLVSRFKENLYNCCHQMSSFKAKIHQIRFRLGICPRPHCLQRSPRTPRYDTIRYIICTEKLTGKLPV